MKAVILHGAIPEDAPPDELDTMVQVEAVRGALVELGHEVTTVPFSLDLGKVAEALRALAPDFVFNLVESVEGAGRLLHLAPALLEFLGVPYTGSGSETLFVTSNKVLANQILRSQAIPTANWYTINDLAGDAPLPKGPYIFKSVWEHASVGLDDDCVVVTDSREALRRGCLERSTGPGGERFVETYIEGREFNIAILAGESGPQVLPASEIRFLDYEGRWKIVNYRAKWHEGSFEYSHTQRRFEFPPEDRPLLEALADIARRCWRIFGLRGYARVDFRVDAAGQPYVLEVNANPCLSPDAGYAATVAQAGMRYTDAVQWIVNDLSRRAGPLAAKAHVEPPPRATVLARVQRTPTPAGELQARGITLREEVVESDKEAVRRILESTGFFYPEEVEVGVELVEERLLKGILSGYYFLMAEKAGEVVGYSSFGPIACTKAAYSIYWIAVHKSHRGQKIGRILLERTEEIIARLGGDQVHIETSSRDQYKPTRAFYVNNGYQQASVLPDFYAPGDGRITYVKRLSPKS